MKTRPYSSLILSLCGLVLMGVGLYFALLRPAVLPEDARYLGMTATQIQITVPGLARWLDKVFWVMGGYIFTTGLLTLSMARTSVRARAPGAGWTIALAGVASIGVMIATNFVLHSDFRWELVGVALLWGAALFLYAIGK